MPPVELTTEMIVVLAILGVTVVLFLTEIFRVDFTAILVLVALGMLSQFPGLSNLADPTTIFDGFSSNAVLSIIAVMIIGSGLDKTGLMSRVASTILRYVGLSEGRIIPVVSATAGGISSFMQNVGAVALFLPVVSRISVRAEIPMSRLLMPMGFCAILGGTMTMVGSSPLILVNDLILNSNSMLHEDEKMVPFSLFAVTPIGMALVLSGILYFVLVGRFVLPGKTRNDAATGRSMRSYIQNLYGVQTDIFEVIVPEDCPFRGMSFRELMEDEHVYVVGSQFDGQTTMSPLVSTRLTTPGRLAVIGRKEDINVMARRANMQVLQRLDVFSDTFAATTAGIAEIVIPPGSSVIGKTPVEMEMRRTYGTSLLALHRGDETLSLVESVDHTSSYVGDVALRAGDTLVSYIRWDRLAKLTDNRDFVVVTQDFPREDLRPKKVLPALTFFLIAIGLILFTNIQLSLCLLFGATGMILTRVLSIEEAYESVSWSTVFLLACLIPLGQAFQATGTASWIAQQVVTYLDGVSVFGLQIGIAVLATGFTLVMSNLGATVLLVPLAVSIAISAGGDPAVFALTVAIATSNSFLIPTHPVNALIMGPAGYKVSDFIKAGGIMTVIFLVVSMGVMSIIF